MVSRIDQPANTPPSAQPRRAEDTDTRQAIQRHDPEFYKKKKDEGEQPGFKDPYEDLAEVSVPALRNFLLGLLDRVSAAPQPVQAPQDAVRHVPLTPQQAAASAYQKRSGPQTPPSPQPITINSDGSAPSALDQAAAGLDRAEVLELIRELDRLYAEGIVAIALEKGDGGFLGGIRAGINRARGV